MGLIRVTLAILVNTARIAILADIVVASIMSRIQKRESRSRKQSVEKSSLFEVFDISRLINPIEESLLNDLIELYESDLDDDEHEEDHSEDHVDCLACSKKKILEVLKAHIELVNSIPARN